MATLISPGVLVTEKDLSGYVSPAATTFGATVGQFSWGPVNSVFEIANEGELVSTFGKPDSTTYHSFFSAANYLAYSDSLKVVRTETSGMLSACTKGQWIPQAQTLTGLVSTNLITASAAIDTLLVVGDQVKFVVDSVETTFTVTEITGETTFKVSANLAAGVAAVAYSKFNNFKIFNETDYESKFGTDLDNGGVFASRYPGATGNSISVSMADSKSFGGTLTGAPYFILPSLTATTTTTLSGKTGTLFTSEITEGGSNLSFNIDGIQYKTLVTDVNSDTDAVVDVAVQVPFAAITGTVEITQAAPTILHGTGTLFQTQLVPDTWIKVYNSNDTLLFTAKIATISSNIAATLSNVTPAISADITGATLKAGVAFPVVTQSWIFADLFNGAPSTSPTIFNLNPNANDELHAVVFDQDGLITGTPGTVLETFNNLSKASDAKTTDGASSYYKNVINNRSKYVWWLSHPSDNDGSNEFPSSPGSTIDETPGRAFGATASPTVNFNLLSRPSLYNLYGGSNGTSATNGMYYTGYDLIANDELYDVSLIVTGKAPINVVRYAIQNVAEIRKDCVVFCSPFDKDTSEPIIGNNDAAVQKVLEYVAALGVSSSYGFMDSGFKYQYDKYNDVYRWVPLNGDIAGVTARVDTIADPWFSPAGFNRGQVKNVAKLAINPGKTMRDSLYKANVNSVVNFPGEGPVLYGDKTMLSKPSAFDRINVRRLFIVVEKSIARSSKYVLFQNNTVFTRAAFVSMVEPFLRDIVGRDGIYEFKIDAGSTVNTPEVIDRNEFVANIYIKPVKSINFILLSFVAVRTGVSFSEITGG